MKQVSWISDEYTEKKVAEAFAFFLNSDENVKKKMTELKYAVKEALKEAIKQGKIKYSDFDEGKVLEHLEVYLDAEGNSGDQISKVIGLML